MNIMSIIMAENELGKTRIIAFLCPGLSEELEFIYLSIHVSHDVFYDITFQSVIET